MRQHILITINGSSRNPNVIQSSRVGAGGGGYVDGLPMMEKYDSALQEIYIAESV